MYHLFLQTNAGVIMMQVADGDSDTNEAEFDINDVFEYILLYCPRRVWLVLNDNHEDSRQVDYCWRPDLCVSFYIKISFQRLREILEPLEWGRNFRCSAIFKPSVDLKRSDATRPLWILVDPSGVEWSCKPPGDSPLLHTFCLFQFIQSPSPMSL